MARLAALQVRPDEPLFQLFLCALKARINEMRKPTLLQTKRSLFAQLVSMIK
jgi:hypothetical protein